MASFDYRRSDLRSSYESVAWDSGRVGEKGRSPLISRPQWPAIVCVAIGSNLSAVQLSHPPLNPPGLKGLVK
ncbi:hypothetical protein [Microcoleus sp. herbarium14]|uniref:hypothetical protein n=1 Tax=Microcoleus sp. herbarium14 TaxID=3055439 RepID=UPI002FD3630E